MTTQTPVRRDATLRVAPITDTGSAVHSMSTIRNRFELTSDRVNVPQAVRSTQNINRSTQTKPCIAAPETIANVATGHTTDQMLQISQDLACTYLLYRLTRCIEIIFGPFACYILPFSRYSSPSVVVERYQQLLTQWTYKPCESQLPS